MLFQQWHCCRDLFVAQQPVSVVCSAPYGEWRSPVARSVRDAEVGGSNPLSPTVRLGVVCIISPIFCMVKHQRAAIGGEGDAWTMSHTCLLYTSPSPRDRTRSRMPSS